MAGGADDGHAGHECGHNKLHRLQPHIMKRHVTGPQDHGDNHGRALQSATYAPMRIRIQYVGINDDPSYAASASLIQNQLMPAAVARLSSMLSVTPVSGPLYAHRDCARYDVSVQPARCVQFEAATDCANFAGEAAIYFTDAQFGQDTYYSGSTPVVLSAGTGFSNADYVFFVTMLQTGICGTQYTGGTIAYAWGCQRDSLTDRPTIGRFNLCEYLAAQALKQDARRLRHGRE